MPEALLWWACLIALCVLLLVPLLLVDVPPLLDYPNHLARLVVLASGVSDPHLSRFYAPRWGIIPDLGIDLIGPPLLRILPVHVAGRIVLAVVLLLPVLGSVAYSRAVLKRRSFWVLGSGLVAYGGTFLLGFLNFDASVGLALLFAAGWVRWRERYPWRTLALAVPGSVALFFCHLMGVVLFGLLIAAHDAACVWRGRSEDLLRDAASRIGALLIVAAAPGLLYLTSALHAEDGPTSFLSLFGKLRQSLLPFVNYWLPLDIAAALLVVFILVGTLLRRRCCVPLSSRIVLGVLLVAYLAAPFGYKGTSNLDSRFAVMFVLLLFAGTAPDRLPRPVARTMGCLLILVFTIRMAVLASAWSGHNADLAAFRSVIRAVPPGSTVFLAAANTTKAYRAHQPVARRLSNGETTDTHLAALLPIERGAWWPFLFDNLSQQPVMTREPYRSLALRTGGMPDAAALTRPGAVDLCGFDYLLLLHAGAEPHLAALLPERLRLLAASDMAALFRVKPDPVCSPAAAR